VGRGETRDFPEKRHGYSILRGRQKNPRPQQKKSEMQGSRGEVYAFRGKKDAGSLLRRREHLPSLESTFGPKKGSEGPEKRESWVAMPGGQRMRICSLVAEKRGEKKKGGGG